MQNSPQRIRWACRRGMLELDRLLLPFFEEAYPSLSSALQEEFLLLLESQDQDLYAWLLYQEPPAPLKAICEQIRKFHQSTDDRAITY